MEFQNKRIARYVGQRITYLLERRDQSDGRAALAELRRGIGHAPGDLPELWGLFLSGLPEDMLSTGGDPTREEWAVYLSMTMFALHQQGKDAPMHRTGESIGAAAAELIESKDDMERVWRRFSTVVSRSDISGIAYHLRSFIQLLKASGVSLDYESLAADLYLLQHPESASRVKLRWGQDFFSAYDKRFLKKEDNND